jgi:phosphatidylethanolamine/phosphatidyl-N-methylethanolamine N-methyltransferase
MSPIEIDSGYKDFYNHLKLSNRDDIKKYFPGKKHNLIDIIVSKIHRIIHLFQTCVWINANKICQWAAGHKEQKISDLFQGQSIQRKVIRYENNMTFHKPGLLESVKNAIKFIFEFIKDPKTVGAILPSSKFLAREIVSQIPKDLNRGSLRIMEWGAGTGVFTRKIIERMNSGDELVVVEFDEHFYKQLCAQYGKIPGVTIIQGDVTKLPESPEEKDKYDYIVSGLPLNAFEPAFVDQILEKVKKLTKKNGVYSAFDYPEVAAIKSIFSNAAEQRKLSQIFVKKEGFYKQHAFKSIRVFRNIPPARVLHHRLINEERPQSFAEAHI